ncbi:MAG: glycoside hydrolase family 44 protein [Chloroflexota bacterium]
MLSNRLITMKFERALFFLTLLLCIGLIISVYFYQRAETAPTISLPSSGSIAQLDSNDTAARLSGKGNQSAMDNSDFGVAQSSESELKLPSSIEDEGANSEQVDPPIVMEEPEQFAAISDKRTDADTIGESQESTVISTESAEMSSIDSAVAENDQTNIDINSQQHRIVFDDTLAQEWQNWSWDTTIDFVNDEPVEQGMASIAVTFDKNWGALWLSSSQILNSNEYDTLRFWIHGGEQGGQLTRVSLADGNQMLLDESVEVVARANTWQQVDIQLTDLNASDEISGIVWQESLGNSQPAFFLDRVSFTKRNSSEPKDAINASSGVEPAEDMLVGNESGSETNRVADVPIDMVLDVDVASERRAIAPAIYGINYGDESLLTTLRPGVRRWGGNASTRYNWQLDVANRASDWFFENIPEEVANESSLPSGSSADKFVAMNQLLGIKTIMTMPMIGWTPKSREFACSYPVNKYGEQQSVDPSNSTCGNGLTRDGTPLLAEPTDTSVAIDATYVSEWITHLVTSFGTAAEGGVTYYSLDNEPMLWHLTHRDIHPEPVSYDELYARTVEYAAAIKEADPSAMTLGPAVWGWTAYFYSALDQSEVNGVLNQNADRAAHGNLPFLAWYLQKMSEYEQENGVRLLDYLDVHYYPQGQRVALGPVGSERTQALRLRSTRSLWDASYVDESWINEPVRLIPRLQEWIDEYYPGTKIAFSEYNWGGLESINGALTQADLLGILGREGVDLATLWDPLNVNAPYTFAFRLYRNYDGSGSEFGDISVHAESADTDQLAIYAAQRTSDGALTILLINKDQDSLTTAVDIANFESVRQAQRFRYSNDNQSAILALPQIERDGSQFIDTLPGNSLTLYVIPKVE